MLLNHGGRCVVVGGMRGPLIDLIIYAKLSLVCAGGAQWDIFSQGPEILVTPLHGGT